MIRCRSPSHPSAHASPVARDSTDNGEALAHLRVRPGHGSLDGWCADRLSGRSQVDRAGAHCTRRSWPTAPHVHTEGPGGTWAKCHCSRSAPTPVYRDALERTRCLVRHAPGARECHRNGPAGGLDSVATHGRASASVGRPARAAGVAQRCASGSHHWWSRSRRTQRCARPGSRGDAMRRPPFARVARPQVGATPCVAHRRNGCAPAGGAGKETGERHGRSP